MLFNTVVDSLRPFLPLCDDLGSCWRELGIALNLSSETLYNINDENNSNNNKAYAVLSKWKEKEGASATMGRVVAALRYIGKNNIVHKLIGVQMFVVCLCLFLF